MKKTAVVIMGCLLGALAFGCREETSFTPFDLSATADMGVNGSSNQDLSMRVYLDATPHQIDTNTAGGMFGDGVAVKLSGMVAVTPVSSYLDRPFCKYQVWVQDPACTTPPCGILVVARGPMVMPLDAGARNCPAAAQAQTLLATTQMGDTVDISGTVDAYRPTGSMVTQHKIDPLDKIEAAGGAAKAIAPLVVADPALFVGKTGTGWATYEGTLIAIRPDGQPLVVQNSFPNDRPTFETGPVGPAQWAYTFLFDDPRVASDGGTSIFPTAGMRFNAITGVVATLFDGQILPRSKAADFDPPDGL